MKPKTTVVMRNIIQQIRENFPFAMSEQKLCAETCSHGCSIKLLEYMDMEITEWERRLDNGEIPNFGDIQKLSKSSTKIYQTLEKNHLVSEQNNAAGITTLIFFQDIHIELYRFFRFKISWILPSFNDSLEVTEP